MRLLLNRLFLLWLIIFGGVLQCRSQPSHFDAIPLTEKKKNVKQLLTAGKAPSAYFLCDSIFQFQQWSSQEEKLDFYAFFYDILLEVGSTNTEIKQYLVNRDYGKFEEVIRLAWASTNQKYISVALNYIHLIRSIYLEKQKNAKFHSMNERLERQLLQLNDQYKQTERSDSIANELLEQEIRTTLDAINQLKEKHLKKGRSFNFNLGHLDSLQEKIPTGEAWVTYFLGKENPNALRLLSEPLS